MRLRPFLQRLSWILLSVCPVWAEPLARDQVPAPLLPWVGWALDGHEAELCPFLNGQQGQKHCLWPGVLTLSLEESGGSFSQVFRVLASDWAVLPGDSSRWPQGVRVDGSTAAVVQRGGLPAVRLKPGLRTVSGSLRWDALPQILRVPPETGLLSLSVNGRSVSLPSRDESGRLWLQKASASGPEESHLEVAVHRRVVDDIPLYLHTRIQLKVSGKNREAVLGKALPDGFAPMSLSGGLPARLDPDGRLRVQARAGTWDLELSARHEGQAKELRLSEAGGAWDPEEAWVFEAKNNLRLVTVEGAPQLDPQQTELPQEWRQFPAYVMKPGSVLRLIERRRGDADPQPDRLSLRRSLWLDFDGRGMTAQDTLSGTLSRSWRLTMGGETALGRAAINGEDQFLTALKSGGPAGLEVRQGALNVLADSRIEGKACDIPAVGWDHDFESVSATLHLPPGWRLLHARGVDSASPTWVKRWTLLDLFLVLIAALAVGRLWDRRWGLWALAAAALSWHEAGAPRWVWLWALAAEALLRALPEGKLRRAALGARWASWAAILLVLLPFYIRQVRIGLFPQLERPHAAMPGLSAEAPGPSGAMNVPGPATLGLANYEQQAEEQAQSGFDNLDKAAPAPMARLQGMMSGAGGALHSKSDYRANVMAQKLAGRPRRKLQYLALDPKSVVNTGPGIPSWSWTSVQLGWSGPVKRDQRLKLWLVSPCANMLLAVLRLLLTAALALLLFGLPVEAWIKSLRSRKGWTAGWRWLFPVLALGRLAFPASAGEIPSKEMIEDLRRRLLEAPSCAPLCVEIPRLRLEAAGGDLALRLEAHAAAAAAVPLPGGGRGWSPARVYLDGASAGVRRSEDGQLWLALPPGPHQVLLEGPLPDLETVAVSLPLKPRRVEASASGWTVHGLREDGVPEDILQLVRRRSSPAAGGKTAAQGSLPPFVSVERVLRLGLSWEVETTLTRLTPAGTPVVLEVPLLAGESVTSADLRVSKGKVQVSLGPQAWSARWISSLDESARIALKAPGSAPWVETWRLEAGPVWHVEARGIPAAHREPQAEERSREWRPWPGETVELAVSRPAGAPGQTLTVDQAALAVSPGLRASDAVLTLRLRTSRGGQHSVVLPEGAELKSVRLDGVLEPLRAEGRRVTVTVRPGSYTAEFSWREPRGIGLVFRTPEVDAGAPAVNAALSVAMPRDRWTLFLGGPRLGPAVLFWAQLAVFFLLSAGLGRLGWTPLRWPQWFLLFLGLTQVKVAAAVLVAGWLAVLGLRGARPPEGRREFNLVQVLLAFLSLLALAILFRSIARGLLGLPDMQIAGNGSEAQLLQWYQDRSGPLLPRAWVLSLPLMAYRLAMLAWALWLAHSLLAWLKWGWSCWSAGGFWRDAAAD